jgi:amino acid transporter
VVVVGIIATSVMECICELVVLWPIPNAMVEYVKTFVDEDLGIAVGIMYWSDSACNTQLLACSNLI